MATAFLAWLDSYSVGHEVLDAQHRQLVAIINEVNSAECANQSHQQLMPLLHAFEMAAVKHFKHENSVMRTICDLADESQPAQSALLKALSEAHINEHYADHARTLITLDSIIHASNYGDDSANRNYSALLKTWFIEHANTSDVHLKAVFAAR